MKIIPLWVKLTALGLVVLALVGEGYYIKSLVDESSARKDYEAKLLERMNKAEDNLKGLDAIFVKKSDFDQSQQSHAADVTVHIKQEASNDPTLRVYLDTRLPDGLRKSFREAAAPGAAASGGGPVQADGDPGNVSHHR